MSTLCKGRFVKGGPKSAVRIRQALRYMQDRPLGISERTEDRRIFTKDQRSMQQVDAARMLDTHTNSRVAYHRLILSPGAPVADLERWTRLVLSDLERHLGQQLHWAAVVHRHTEHPHSHVLIAGTGASLRDPGGRERTITLRRPEYTLLREAGERRSQELLREEDRFQGTLLQELAVFARLLSQEPEQQPSSKHLRASSPSQGAPGRDATRDVR